MAFTLDDTIRALTILEYQIEEYKQGNTTAKKIEDSVRSWFGGPTSKEKSDICKEFRNELLSFSPETSPADYAKINMRMGIHIRKQGVGSHAGEALLAVRSLINHKLHENAEYQKEIEQRKASEANLAREISKRETRTDPFDTTTERTQHSLVVNELIDLGYGEAITTAKRADYQHRSENLQDLLDVYDQDKTKQPFHERYVAKIGANEAKYNAAKDRAFLMVANKLKLSVANVVKMLEPSAASTPTPPGDGKQNTSSAVPNASMPAAANGAAVYHNGSRSATSDGALPTNAPRDVTTAPVAVAAPTTGTVAVVSAALASASSSGVNAVSTATTPTQPPAPPLEVSSPTNTRTSTSTASAPQRLMPTSVAAAAEAPGDAAPPPRSPTEHVSPSSTPQHTAATTSPR